MRSFASVLQAQGKLMQAEGCYSECLEAMQRTLGRTNVSTLKTMAGFAQVMEAQGRLAEAQAMLVDCVAGMRDLQHTTREDTAVFSAAERQLEALRQRS
jgi:DNA-binding ferritin-like protein